ncbi:MAG: hypothetical protein KY461_07125, partial [Actinobacteria bacterium]|nr:hypothetical protein [Actinomycetota bacterium]
MQPFDRAWDVFRSIPWWGQALLWLGLAPVLGALLILRRDPAATLNRAVAAGVLVLGGALWLDVGTPDPANDPVAAETAADAQRDDEEPLAARPASEATPPASAIPSPSPAPAPSPSPSPSPSPAASPSPSPAPVVLAAMWTVTYVVDGDTLDVRSSDGVVERVRIIGIDTPERGDCGFGDA